MAYLIFEVAGLLAIASILGVFCGYSLQSFFSKRSEHKLTNKLVRISKENDQYKSKLDSLGVAGHNYNKTTNKGQISDLDKVTSMLRLDQNKLKNLGINTNVDLLEVAKNPLKIIELAETLQVEELAITNLISKADLLRIPGMNEDKLRVLEEKGIRSVKQLARENPDTLSEKIVVNSSDRQLEDQPEIKDWIEKAARLTG